MTNQTEINNVNYLIDPTFNKVNRLFVLSLENEEDRINIFFKVLYTKTGQKPDHLGAVKRPLSN